MNIKALFEDDGAVSPVIGVILMVAITVILAAVIGTFVLGLGDRVSQASPNAQFTFEYTQHGSDDAVNISHDGGDGVEAEQLTVTIDGMNAYNDSSINSTPGPGYTNALFADVSNGWTDKITAGDELSIAEGSSASGDPIEDGDTVKVIWTASGSDKTAVIGESEVSL
ncbi:type IV pilin [Halorussus salinisoli]|uniref:type IV pilin n=1 Tax=Halorussus salinisoli TaxID=2558242 RepID=UPI0010C2221D|nr:type IV pilin N-terminal domain-containing protein [Halorussus salinisoli]